MSIYKARYKNALRICARINRLIKRGYIVLDSDGERIFRPFELRGKDIVLPVSKLLTGNQCNMLYFTNDIGFDNGIHTKISDFNKKFVNWTIIDSKYCKKIIT